MTIDSVYRFDLDLYRKDHKGVVLPPDVFNNWIQFVSLNMFNGVVTQAESLAAQGNMDIADVIFKMTILGNFIKDLPIDVSQGTIGNITVLLADIPPDCKLTLGMTVNGEIITKKSPVMKAKYRGSVLNGDLSNNPVYFVQDGKIEFLRNDLSTTGSNGIILIYLRHPAVPYFDFCMSSSDQIIFMPAGSYIAAAASVAVEPVTVSTE